MRGIAPPAFRCSASAWRTHPVLNTSELRADPVRTPVDHVEQVHAFGVVGGETGGDDERLQFDILELRPVIASEFPVDDVHRLIMQAGLCVPQRLPSALGQERAFQLDVAQT